ncbi:MAG: methylated-DNA--[protein]-cysteine S-methyltransferase [Planctomycetes bacterium]|nr:methylated-DNA--[protein]-cysteine S-methyltransferase [Planctomycetota bacterium]
MKPALASAIHVDSPIGTLVLVADDLALREIRLPKGAPPAAACGDPARPILLRARRQLDEYFAGRRRAFDLPLDPGCGTPFQRLVWRTLLTIPFAATISYGELAERVGRPNAQRAVGAANSRNPLPIVVPCHRVIGKDGRLVGFGGGLDAKQALIELERRHAAAPVDGALFSQSAR